jgi:uncharacterized membrane protein YoaK (UPF0700 family)
MSKSEQMSETYLAGALLAVVGGFLDAYSYICRGHVFANAQTGNIVLFGIKIAAGEWKQSLYYLIPILSFLIGIAVAEIIKSCFGKNESINWKQSILILEVAALISVAFIPQGKADMLANTLVSFVCALQVEAFRRINGKAYASTMCTGNLRSATEMLYNYRRTKDKKALRDSLQYYGIILFFILGAAIGAFVINIFAIKSVFFACIILVMVFIILFIKKFPSGSK